MAALSYLAASGARALTHRSISYRSQSHGARALTHRSISYRSQSHDISRKCLWGPHRNIAISFDMEKIAYVNVADQR